MRIAGAKNLNIPVGLAAWHPTQLHFKSAVEIFPASNSVRAKRVELSRQYGAWSVSILQNLNCIAFSNLRMILIYLKKEAPEASQCAFALGKLPVSSGSIKTCVAVELSG